MKGHAKGTYFTKAVIVMSLIVTSTPRAGMQHPTIGSKPHCVYIGGKSEAKNQQFLESSNISHILNVVSLYLKVALILRLFFNNMNKKVSYITSSPFLFTAQKHFYDLRFRVGLHHVLYKNYKCNIVWITQLL